MVFVLDGFRRRDEGRVCSDFFEEFEVCETDGFAGGWGCAGGRVVGEGNLAGNEGFADARLREPGVDRLDYAGIDPGGVQVGMVGVVCEGEEWTEWVSLRGWSSRIVRGGGRAMGEARSDGAGLA